MTIENDKNENAAGDDGASENEKTAKIAEKLKKMGVSPSAKQEPEESKRRFLPLLITILLAIPAAALILYYFMPQQVNHFVSSFTSKSSVMNERVSTEGGTPPSVNNINKEPKLTAQAPASRSAQLEANRMNGMQQPDWAKQQQQQMEKRRAEFDKRNADYYASNNRSVSTPAELPQWIKDRSAQMDKDRAAYQQQMEKYHQDMVKQQQEMMKQQQQWSRQPVNHPYNGSNQQPGYMNQPQMNTYQPNNYGAQNQAQQMPSNVANAYPQNQRRYYNNQPPQAYYYNRAPYYGNGPQFAPNGFRGYR